MKTYKIILSLLFSISMFGFTEKSKDDLELAIIKKFFNSDVVTRQFHNLTPYEDKVIMRYIATIPSFPTTNSSDLNYKPVPISQTRRILDISNAAEMLFEPPTKDNRYRIHTILMRDKIENFLFIYQNLDTGNLFSKGNGDVSNLSFGKLNFLSLGYSCRITSIIAQINEEGILGGVFGVNRLPALKNLSFTYQDCQFGDTIIGNTGFDVGDFSTFNGTGPLLDRVSLPFGGTDCFFGLSFKSVNVGSGLAGLAVRFCPCN
jgi:hypothetical protein